ncbi:MAG: 7TM domain-containing protein [Microgenomates group bacterium]
MKKVLMVLAIFLFFLFPVKSWAAPLEDEVPVASVSAEVVVERGVDLTIPSEKGDRLTTLMNEQKLTGWWGKNVLKIAMRKAVSEGVSPNTLVLLFLFPLVAALVAFSRQVVGVSGFGMITPALLSVAFLSTGGLAGVVLLFFILGVATLGRMLIKKVKVPYFPKLAILIWVVSMAVLLLLLMSPLIGLERLMSVGIFPIMLFVLLAETFIEAQITRSISTSMWMTVETVIVALIAYKLMSAPWIQSQVLLHPEISVIGILGLDYLIGTYKGLRLLEIWRFRKLLSK